MRKNSKIQKCIVKNCDFLCSDVEFSEKNFHVLPRNPELKQIWLNALQLTEGKVTQRSAVCSNHFTPSDYNFHRLKKGSIPSVNLVYGTNNYDFMSSTFNSYDFEDETQGKNKINCFIFFFRRNFFLFFFCKNFFNSFIF